MERVVVLVVLFTCQADDFNTKALSEAEYKEVAVQYSAVTATPNVTPGLPTGLPKRCCYRPSAQWRDGGDANHAIGGYLVFEAETIEAIRLASRIPAASRGGAIEVRRSGLLVKWALERKSHGLRVYVVLLRQGFASCAKASEGILLRD